MLAIYNIHSRIDDNRIKVKQVLPADLLGKPAHVAHVNLAVAPVRAKNVVICSLFHFLLIDLIAQTDSMARPIIVVMMKSNAIPVTILSRINFRLPFTLVQYAPLKILDAIMYRSEEHTSELHSLMTHSYDV